MTPELKRIAEIIYLAKKLGWIRPTNNTSYPLMQLSEVEKCMVAMYDDHQLKLMRHWCGTKGILIQK